MQRHSSQAAAATTTAAHPLNGITSPDLAPVGPSLFTSPQSSDAKLAREGLNVRRVAFAPLAGAFQGGV